MELKDIRYRFVVDLTKFFLEKYRTGELKDLGSVVQNVKSASDCVWEMSFVFDESIWTADKPELCNDLVQFNVQLKNTIEYLPFRLLVSGGFDQQPMMLNSAMGWDKPGSDKMRYAVYVDCGGKSPLRSAEMLDHVRANLKRTDPESIFFVFSSNENKVVPLSTVISDEGINNLLCDLEKLKTE